jgi:hypothetical protein
LTVNRFVNIPRKYIRNLRGALHAWKTHGLAKAEERFLESYDTRTRDQANFESVIFGRIQYVGMIRGYDDDIYKRFRHAYNALCEKQIPIHETSNDYKLEHYIWVIESTWQTEIEGKRLKIAPKGLRFS